MPETWDYVHDSKRKHIKKRFNDGENWHKAT